MTNLEKIYNEKCERASDINEHLPTLKKYSEECDHITEIGVRNIVSTYAFLMGKPKKMISYDIQMCDYEKVREMCKENTDFEFIIGDTRTITIEETDLLFIDTLHNYNQIKTELRLHGNKSKKYLIFHDTTLFANIGESYEGVSNELGIWPAIEEFMVDNPHWVLHEKFENNCGLTILKRI